MVVSESGLGTRCYWQPPTDGRIRYPRANDYIEHFHELLKQAVADRMREKVGIFFSGGLDSGAVAASAKEIAGSRGGTPKLLNVRR